MKKRDVYVVGGRPRSAYQTARIMGFSKREARRLVKWTKRLVASIMSSEAP